MDALGHLLALPVTPANEQDRVQVAALAQAFKVVTEQRVTVAFGDQDQTGEAPAQAAQEQGHQREVVKLPEAKRGFVLLPKRWMAERSFAWVSRLRRLARYNERLASSPAALHLLAFVRVLLQRAASLLQVP